MLSFMTLGLVSVLLSIITGAASPYVESYGTIPFVIGYIWHLLLLVAIVTNIELFKSDNIEAVKEVKNLQFLNFWCDLYNFLIGLGVFCFGLDVEANHPEDWVFIFFGLVYVIISMAPTIFLVIFNANTTRFTFRAMMFILQTVCFAIIVVCQRNFTGEQI